jgi:hypothetical protein
MKTILKASVAWLLLTVVFLSAPQKADANVNVSFQIFYDQLSPYGSWIHYPSYGYVWVPNVPAGFAPYYSNGHWVYTQFGWMWISGYSWGWAAFHYGNWFYDPFYGWIWVPGNTWAPAWVAWCSSPGYYGWAPLAPGININIVLGGGYRIPDDRWVFLPTQHLGNPNVEYYYGPRSSNKTIIRNTTIINNTYVDNSTNVTYVTGPRREEVEKASGKSIQTKTVRMASQPGTTVNGDEVRIYRPTVEKEYRSGMAPAPREVKTKEEVKTIRQREAEEQRPQPVKIEQPHQPKQQPRKVPAEQQNGITQPRQKHQDAKVQPTQIDRTYAREGSHAEVSKPFRAPDSGVQRVQPKPVAKHQAESSEVKLVKGNSAVQQEKAGVSRVKASDLSKEKAER